MSRTYNHLMQADGSYQVQEVREDGASRIVATDHPTYLAWLAAGGEPAVVAYVAPAVPDLATLQAQAVAEVRAAMESIRVEYYPTGREIDIRRQAEGYGADDLAALNGFIDGVLRVVSAQAVIEIEAAESPEALAEIMADYRAMYAREML